MPLPLRLEEPAQRPRDARQHDVVDRCLEDVAHQLHVLERHRQRGEPLAVGDRAVERRPRRAEERGRRLLAAAGQLAVVQAEVGDDLDARLQRRERLARLARQRRGRVRQHPRVRGQRVGLPLLGQRHEARPRREVEERRQHRRTAHPVEDRVMHLGHQRRPLPLEPLHDVHLPQRAVGIERPAHHRRHERVELGLAARRRQAGPGDVVVQLEVRVVDPHGVVEPEGHPHRPLAERPHQVQALLDHAADLRVARRRREERAPPLRRVHDQRHAHVHRGRRRLERQERRVHPDQGPHHRPFLPAAAPRVTSFARRATAPIRPPCARSRPRPARTGPAPRPRRARRPPGPPPRSRAGRCGRPGAPRSPRPGRG